MFSRIKSIFTKGREPGKQADTPADGKGSWKLGDIASVNNKPARPASEKKATAATPVKKQVSPEELCGVTSKMGKDEVREKLAGLYRRYNRATSSLDPKLRAEAEEMLDAVVAIREKVFGPI